MNINLQTKYNLPVHHATLAYIYGIDPELQWESRGLSAHSMERQKIENLKKESMKLFEIPEKKKEFDQFINESIKIFMDITSGNENVVKKYFGDKKFYFVIGAMRSGGTYALTETCKIMNIDYKKRNLHMQHDSIPTYNYIFEWNNPKAWLSLAFEFAQYLNWARREYQEHDCIIQKRIAYAHSLPFLQKIFRDQAEYIITVRHPAGIAESFKKMENIDMSNISEPGGWKAIVKERMGVTFEEWNHLTYEQRVLKFWEVFYNDIVDFGVPEGKIHVIDFSTKGFETFFENFSEEKGKYHESSNFKPKQKEFIEYWKTDEVNTTIEKVRINWEYHGLKFPELKLL